MPRRTTKRPRAPPKKSVMDQLVVPSALIDKVKRLPFSKSLYFEVYLTEGWGGYPLIFKFKKTDDDEHAYLYDVKLYSGELGGRYASPTRLNWSVKHIFHDELEAHHVPEELTTAYNSIADIVNPLLQMLTLADFPKMERVTKSNWVRHFMRLKFPSKKANRVRKEFRYIYTKWQESLPPSYSEYAEDGDEYSNRRVYLEPSDMPI